MKNRKTQTRYWVWTPEKVEGMERAVD